MTVETMRKEVKALEGRSAWDRGVTAYALELLENLEEALDYNPDALTSAKLLEKALLSGAGSWEEFSLGGSSLIYDGDIAERLCNSTELKRTKGGERRPNSREEWLDTQARALHQAANRIKKAYRRAAEA